MNRSFLDWFKETGYRSYLLPYIIFLGVTAALVLSVLLYPESFGEMPVVWWIVGCVAYFGFFIGITKHMVDKYEQDTK